MAEKFIQIQSDGSQAEREFVTAYGGSSNSGRGVGLNADGLVNYDLIAPVVIGGSSQANALIYDLTSGQPQWIVGVLQFLSSIYNTGGEGADGQYIKLVSSSLGTLDFADVEWNDVQSKPTFAAVATSGVYTDLSGTPTLAAVATSGDYTDLSNTPNVAAWGHLQAPQMVEYSTKETLTDSFAVIAAGSFTIDFTPVRASTGGTTSQVWVEAQIPLSRGASTDAIGHFQVYVDGSAVSTLIGTDRNVADTVVPLKFKLPSHAAATEITIDIRARRYSGKNAVDLFCTHNWNGTTSEESALGFLKVWEEGAL